MSEHATNYRQVHVSFRKQVSDGNYGTEAAEVTLEDYVHPDAEASTEMSLAELMLRQARSLVHGELARSPTAKVRQTVLEAVKSTVALGPDELDEDDDMPIWSRP